jgi:FtsH-binding integral membrane protein
MHRTKKERQKTSKNSRLTNTFKSLMTLLRKRYIWAGLLLGFVWSFSTPFILTAFQESLHQFPQEAIYALFFPMTLALYTIVSIVGPEGYIDPLLLWGFSIIIGMIIGVIITYFAHLTRVLLKTKKGRC